MSLATDNPRESAAASAVAAREREPSAADPEHSATVEGGWGATLPGSHSDAETTAPGPMAITNVEALPPPGQARPTTHPPGMITTMRPGMMTTALGTLHDGVGKGSRASTLTPGTIIDGK